MGDEPVQLDEAPLVQQQVEPLAGGELALLVLLRDPLGPPTLLRERLALMQVVEEFSRIGHGG